MKWLSIFIIATSWLGVLGIEVVSYTRVHAFDPTVTPILMLFIGGALHQLGIQTGLPLVNGEAAKATMALRLQSQVRDPPSPDQAP